jgi:ABC-type branched-subunit amino acid transport system permease subunit
VLLEELRFAKEIRFSIFGILLILSVLFFPNGLVRIPQMIRRKWNS